MISKLTKNSLKMCNSSLILIIHSSFLTTKRQINQDLILIRHAQSQFNRACEDYRKLHNIPYVWKQLCNHQGFDQRVLFNLEYMDCSLTDFGINECKKTKSILEKQEIDCILVSPQMRALQTCSNIFQNTSKPIIVEPLLVGPLRSCCDINKPTKLKQKLFPNYNFSRTEQYPQLWYLEYLPPKQVQICHERFQQKGLNSFEEQRKQLVNLLKEGKIYEGAIQYRQRIQQIKHKLIQYKQVFNNIAIVSHYYTIEYLSARQYQECGKPKYYIDVKNCKPYYLSLQQILSVKEQISNQTFGK